MVDLPSFKNQIIHQKLTKKAASTSISKERKRTAHSSREVHFGMTISKTFTCVWVVVMRINVVEDGGSGVHMFVCVVVVVVVKVISLTKISKMFSLFFFLYNYISFLFLVCLKRTKGRDESVV